MRQNHAELARRPAFRLGQAEVRPATREVVGPGGCETVEPRVMQVLAALADTAGETITRDELLERCWNGTVVDEGAINRVIAKVRRLAEGVAQSSFEVETITKVGYRLVVPAPSKQTDDNSVITATSELSWSRRGLLGSGALLAGALTLGGWALLTPRQTRLAEVTALHERSIDALRYMLPERDAQAVALLSEALALDQGYAAGWGTLALAHQRAAEFGPPTVAVAAEARTREAAQRALALDPANADALAALALIEPALGNWSSVERRYQDVLRRYPSHPPLLAGYAKLLSEVGRFDEAMVTMDRIFALEPLAPGYHFRRALGLWSAGRPSESERLIERALRMWPDHPSIRGAAFWLFAHLGRSADAIRLLGTDPTKGPVGVEAAFMRRCAEVLESRRPDQIAEAVRLNRLDASTATSLAEQAMSFASAVGAVDSAFEIADAYYFGEGFTVGDRRAEGGANMPRTRRKTLILFWPTLAAARADARFAKLTDRIGLTKYWSVSGNAPDFMST